MRSGLRASSMRRNDIGGPPFVEPRAPAWALLVLASGTALGTWLGVFRRLGVSEEVVKLGAVSAAGGVASVLIGLRSRRPVARRHLAHVMSAALAGVAIGLTLRWVEAGSPPDAWRWFLESSRAMRERNGKPIGDWWVGGHIRALLMPLFIALCAGAWLVGTTFCHRCRRYARRWSDRVPPEVGSAVADQLERGGKPPSKHRSQARHAWRIEYHRCASCGGARLHVAAVDSWRHEQRLLANRELPPTDR